MFCVNPITDFIFHLFYTSLEYFQWRLKWTFVGWINLKLSFCFFMYGGGGYMEKYCLTSNYWQRNNLMWNHNSVITLNKLLPCGLVLSNLRQGPKNFECTPQHHDCWCLEHYVYVTTWTVFSRHYAFSTLAVAWGRREGKQSMMDTGNEVWKLGGRENK